MFQNFPNLYVRNLLGLNGTYLSDQWGMHVFSLNYSIKMIMVHSADRRNQSKPLEREQENGGQPWP